MKYIKMLGLMAAAVAALMAFAGTASATTLTSPAGTSYTGKIVASTEGKVSLHGENGVTVECEGTVEGTIETHSSTTTAHGPISALTWKNCTGGTPTTVTNGRLIAHTATKANDGTLTSQGTKVSIAASSIFGTITCVYATGGTEATATHIGTLTGSANTGGNATLDISATIPRVEGSSLCGSNGIWTGSYKVTAPAELNVH
jgi:hypothetical protein